MSEATQEERKVARASENKTFWQGVSFGILCLFCAINIFMLLFIVPKFEHIFEDAIPGKPLPSVTNLILAYRVAIAFATLGWPVLSAFLISRRIPYTVFFVNIVLIITFLQLGITIISLFMPMVGTTEGMGP